MFPLNNMILVIVVDDVIKESILGQHDTDNIRRLRLSRQISLQLETLKINTFILQNKNQDGNYSDFLTILRTYVLPEHMKRLKKIAKSLWNIIESLNRKIVSQPLTLLLINHVHSMTHNSGTKFQIVQNMCKHAWACMLIFSRNTKWF